MKDSGFFARNSTHFFCEFLLKFTFLIIIIGSLLTNVVAQFGNTISGFVFNSARQPISNISIELLDEYSRTISRTKTNASGQYKFSGMKSGRFQIRVSPFGTDYSEQEQDVEIQNFASRQQNGSIITSGFENVQKDFYLSLRKESKIKERSEVIFVQEIPEEAKKKYQKGIELLNNQKLKEAYKELISAIEIFPTYFDALERLGTEYVKTKHYVPAEILLYNAVEVNPRANKSWYGLAFAQFAQNKINAATISIERAVSLNQSQIEPFILYGVIERQQENFTLAEKNFLKAKEISNGKIPEVHWQLAVLYANNLNRYDEAIKELELYLKLSSNKIDIEKIREMIQQLKIKLKNQKDK